MKVKFLLTVFSLLITTLLSAQVSPHIRLNQVGFYPEGEKLAGVITNSSSLSFTVNSSVDNTVVFSGTLSSPEVWDQSGESVAIADFSELTTAGVYYITVDEVGTSYDFIVGERVNLGVARAALKAYYFNRSSTSISETYGGKWAREEGHPDDKVLVHASAASDERPANTVISAPKGWYDAGDYGKYVVNSGISTYTLLSAYQHYSGFLDALNTNIPESENELPDILDEVLWNMEWLFAMQDPNDGGVYHKLATANFAGAVMPAEADASRYVVQKSTAASLNFAAVMAQGYRVFKSRLPDLANSYLLAAKNAYEWAKANPEVYYNQSVLNNQYDPDIQTGEYGDNNVSDEFNWAAVELYLATGDDFYYDESNIDYNGWFGTAGWNYVSPLPLISLSLDEHELTAIAADDIDAVEAAILRMADNYVATKVSTPYRISHDRFYWGSNSTAANQGMLLLVAYKISANDKYLNAANAIMDYVLGRNATTYSFITGVGKHPPMNIHHRQSEADDIDEPVPGFLAGGPNPGQEDGCSYPSALPAKSYTDDWCSYASNEVTINWNSPLVFLAAGLESHYEANGFSNLNQKPQQPVALNAISEANQVYLKWVIFDADVSGTIIERSKDNQDNFEVIGEVAGSILDFRDENTESGTVYYYRVKGENMFGFSEYSEAASTTTEGITGIVDQSSKKEFSFSPNPSYGMVRLHFEDEAEIKHGRIKILDLQGKVVREVLLENVLNDSEIHLKELKGTFIISVEKEGDNFRQKLILL
jgi:endoglucanase